MNTIDAIKTKRAVRNFTAQPISDAALNTILEAGRRSASAKNTQPWHFIVIRDPDRLKALSELGHWAGHLAGANVGLVLLSAHPDERWSIMFDLGRTAQNMMLAAWELGIGSVMASIYEAEKARELLGFPDHLHVRAAISFGYPAEAVFDRPARTGLRRQFEDVVHWERW